MSQALIQKAIKLGVAFNFFNEGNGDKILKRLINLAAKYRIEIDDNTFYAILCEKPACRDALYGWYIWNGANRQKLGVFERFLNEGHAINDAAQIQIAVASCSLKLSEDNLDSGLIDGLIKSFNHKELWGFYSKLWLLSKYGTERQLIELI